jgi:lipooligosaccharide transport system permease protein
MFTLILRNYLIWKRRMPVFLALYVLAPMCVLYALYLGFGEVSPYRVEESYFHFLLTGFIVNTAAISSFWSTTYSNLSKLVYGTYYEGVLATTVRTWEISAGEIIWNALRSSLVGTLVAVGGIILTGPLPLAYIFAIPVCFITAAASAALGMVVLSMARSHDDIAPFEALISALFAFSGVFVATSALPDVLVMLAWAFPIYHGVVLLRSIVAGPVNSDLLIHVAFLTGYSALLFTACTYCLNKRLRT